MKHKHHITPKHMGGSDEFANIIELTIEEHAEAHRILFEKYGKIEDKIAWQGLLGLVPKAETIKELHRLGRKKCDDVLIEKYGVTNPGQLLHNRMAASDRHKQMHSSGKLEHTYLHNREDYYLIQDKAKSPEAIKKRKETYSKINHQQGETNSQFGTMWITDGLSNKKIKNNMPIPSGWYKGRKINK